MLLPAAAATGVLGKVAIGAAAKSALGTAATTLGVAGLNQALADRSFRKEKEWWKEQFDYSAKYDTPKAQMKRLKEAGLNPALMYGGPGSVQGAPSPQMGNLESANAELGSLALMSGEVQNLKAELGIKRAQEGYIQQQALTEAQKGRLTSAQASVAQELIGTNIDLSRSQLQLRQQEIISAQIDNYIKNETLNEKVQMATAELNAKLALIENLDQKTKNLQAEKLLTEARTKLEGMGLDKSIQSAILLAVAKMFGVGEEATPAKTIDDKIKEAEEQGREFTVKQLKNKKKLIQRQNRMTIMSGKMSDYGPTM